MPHSTIRRLVTAAALGYLAFAYIAFGELARLLELARRTPAGGAAGFSPRILTVPRLSWPLPGVWTRAELADAFGVLAGPDATLVTRLLCWYLAVDVLVALALFWLLRVLLLRLGRGTRTAAAYAVADLLETAAGLLATATGQVTSPWVMSLVNLLSAAKWAALGSAVGLIALTWWRNVRPTAAPVAGRRAVAARPPWPRVLPQLLVVAAFLFLMAVPGPSAMTQFPDVLRAGLERAPGGSASRSFIFLSAPFLLVAATAVATWLATATPRRPALALPVRWRWLWPTAVGLVASVVLLGLLAADGDAKPAAAAWVAVPTAVLVLGLVARRVIPTRDEPTPPLEAALLPAPAASFSPAARRRLTSGLSAALLVGASLGLVRAALPPALLGVPGPAIPYPVLAVLGVAGAVAAPLATELLALAIGRISRRRTALWRAALAGVLLLLTVAVLRLALHPVTAAPQIGTPGVIAAAFGAAAVGAALLTRLSLLSPSAEALRQLRIGGGRPSWLSYLLAVWLVSSLLGGPTGYHDLRTMPSARGTAPTLEVAVDRWLSAHATVGGPCVTTTAGGRRVVPLVLVAAPGGGIRAAYWTVAAFDELFAADTTGGCPGALFAVAGVSGGSVGATVRLLIPPTERALPAVAAMARDGALAANTAALFFRDLPQSWFPATDRWDDRAAVQERVWEADAAVLAGTPAAVIGAAWASASGIGGIVPPHPGVLLGSASINDGCRAFTASWSGVVAPGNGCTDRGGGGFALTASHDVRSRLLAPRTGVAADLPAVTAALASARFPWVSPSGAVRREGIPDVLYLADGGIYENTGLLGMLQLWDSIAPRVADHNRGVLADLGGREPQGVLVEPWLVFLNNGFEGAPPAPQTARPRELSAPIASALQRIEQVTIGENALLQAAEQRFRGPLPGTSADPPQAERVVVLRPTGNDPGLTAPLGWVLAPSTQTTLDHELREALGAPDAVALLARLRPG